MELISGGCAKDNRGLGGGGSILRDCNGSVLADFFGEVTNMVAEAKALLQGVQRCMQQGISRLIIEVDPLILAQIMQKKVDCPWHICYVIRTIEQMLIPCEYTIQHVYRECNCAADWLANIGCRSGKYWCFTREQLPKRLKGIVGIDKCGLPCIRKRMRI